MRIDYTRTKHGELALICDDGTVEVCALNDVDTLRTWRKRIDAQRPQPALRRESRRSRDKREAREAGYVRY